MNCANAGVNHANADVNHANAGMNRNEPLRRNGSLLKAFPKLAAKTTFIRSFFSAHRKPRTDSEGYTMPRQQYKKQQRQSSMKKIFIGNNWQKALCWRCTRIFGWKEHCGQWTFSKVTLHCCQKVICMYENDYNFRLLWNDKDYEDFEIRENVDPGVMAQ